MRPLVDLLAAPCLFLLLSAPAVAVDPPSKLRFDRLSLDDGLPHLVVLSILQDRQGFLWIATQGGVVRLDGYGEQHATVFRHDHKDPSSLSDSWVWKIIEDRRARLWLATSRGLDRFDPKTETFEASSMIPTTRPPFPAIVYGQSTRIRAVVCGWEPTTAWRVSRFDPAP